MTLPSLPVTNGPGQRDLELAILARNLGARAKFTISLRDKQASIIVDLRILNFSFTTCHGPIYNLGGHLEQVHPADRKFLPPFNFVFLKYNAEDRRGDMEFSNAE